MSSQASIGTIISDLQEFFSALSDLNCAYRKVERLKTSEGRVHKVEAVFRDNLGRQAGLQKTDKGYQIITDCEGLSPVEAQQQRESVQQIVQRYAYRKVLKELQAQGYVVAEENHQPDNSIRLLVRKWAS
jgi:hypothetical protein